MSAMARLHLHGQNPRDDSREDYAPRDPTEVLYNPGTKVFSYKRRSQLFKDTHKGRLSLFVVGVTSSGLLLVSRSRGYLV